TLDLREEARRVADALAPSMPARPIRIEADTTVPLVRAEAHRFEQILGNLISNANKYGIPGTPIDVEIRGGDGEVRAAVTNEGEGIGAADVPHVFDRCRRCPLPKKATGSLGLGLYIAKSLVELHGGRIWVESEPGRTTRFTFSFPALVAKQRKTA